MSKLFYRYIRPVRFDEQKVEPLILPRGGICLRFEERNAGEYSFTYSRCLPNELFSKSVAKRIADERASHHNDVIETPFAISDSETSKAMTASVVEVCRNWVPALAPHPFYVYMCNELRELGRALEVIVVSNNQEQQRAEIWRAGVQASQYLSIYELQSKPQVQATGNI